MSWTVHHERGVKAFHSGRPRVAVSCLEKALATIEQDPSAAATTSSASRAKSRALLHLARAYLVLSKPAEALKHAKALVKTLPKWNPGHSVLGHCFVALGQTKDAKSAFQHALSSCSTDTNSSTAISRLDKGELVACPIVAKAVLAMKGVKNKEMQESKDSDNLTRVHKEDTIGGASSGKKKEKGRRKTSKYVPFSPTAAAKAHAFSEDGGIVGACARKGVALTPSSSSPAPTPALVTTSTGATIGHQRRAARSARFASDATYLDVRSNIPPLGASMHFQFQVRRLQWASRRAWEDATNVEERLLVAKEVFSNQEDHALIAPNVVVDNELNLRLIHGRDSALPFFNIVAPRMRAGETWHFVADAAYCFGSKGSLTGFYGIGDSIDPDEPLHIQLSLLFFETPAEHRLVDVVVRDWNESVAPAATGKQQQFERAFKVAQVQVGNVVEVAKVLNARGSKAFRAGQYRSGALVSPLGIARYAHHQYQKTEMLLDMLRGNRGVTKTTSMRGEDTSPGAVSTRMASKTMDHNGVLHTVGLIVGNTVYPERAEVPPLVAAMSELRTDLPRNLAGVRAVQRIIRDQISATAEKRRMWPNVPKLGIGSERKVRAHVGSSGAGAGGGEAKATVHSPVTTSNESAPASDSVHSSAATLEATSPGTLALLRKAKSLEEISVICSSNQAACMLKFGPPHSAVDCADTALAMEPLHSKSLFRRALARGELVDDGDEGLTAASSLSHLRKAVADLGLAATCTIGSNHSRILQEIRELEEVASTVMFQVVQS